MAKKLKPVKVTFNETVKKVNNGKWVSDISGDNNW